MPSVENLLGLTLQKCCHPTRLRDEKHGGFIYVPCQKCTNCIEAKRNTMARRLDLEAKGSAACLFITLTYDNNHIPRLVLDADKSLLHSNRTSSDDVVVDNPSELSALFPIQTGHNTFDEGSYSYCCKSDIQKFLKRLRRNLDYDSQNLLSSVSRENRTFRYFICSEYGPKTLRAHYHGLLFFQNKCVADAVRTHYIYKSWGLCSPANLRVETLFGPASGYVAKYVNKSSGVPLLLRQPSTSTFYLSSRRPAIGCSYLRKLNIFNSVKERNFKYTQIVKSKDGSVTSVPMSYPKQISGYFFPKCYRFSLLDRSQLLRIYGSNPNFSIVKQINRKYNIRTSDNPTGCLLSSVTHMFTTDELVYGISTNRTCSRRCAAYCSTFHVSIEKYIDDLLAYYTHMSSEVFGFFVDYLNDHNFSFSTLVNAYPSSFASLPKHVDLLVFDRSNQSLEDLLNSYGLTLTDLYLSDGSLNPICNSRYLDTPEFRKFSDTVLHKKQDFEQKRLYSHMSNQLLKNYEAF